jgi:hypothetical protein
LQPPSPFTEDTAAMQQQQMQALGVDQVASDARSRLQTMQLHSDMCAFKAANPCAVFADFLRWYRTLKLRLPSCLLASFLELRLRVTYIFKVFAPRFYL